MPALDELRGFCLLLMLLYHAAYDLITYCQIPIPLYTHPLLQNFLQPLFAGLFLLLSGCCCLRSRHPFRRGVLALGCGLLATAATLLAQIGLPDWFGILHLIGCMKLLCALLRRPLRRLPPLPSAIACLLFFFLFYQLPYGRLGCGPVTLPLPAWLYQSPCLFPLGLPGPGFASADYFPLLPWGFLFLLGVFLGEELGPAPPAGLLHPHFPPLAWLGRHSLAIYLLHQPVLVWGLPPLTAGLRALGLPI